MSNPFDTPPTTNNPYSLYGITLARFREAFGEARLTAGNDYQWSLKTSPFGNDIHVLVNGLDQQPVVWIFDPNDRNDGVNRSMIEREDGIIDVIDHIRARVKQASLVSRKVKEPREGV